jgi:hypothetical protein
LVEKQIPPPQAAEDRVLRVGMTIVVVGVTDLKPVFPGFDNNRSKFPGLVRS